MNVIVMGCGRVGSRLARSMDVAGHRVTVVDSDPESFRRLGSQFAGRTVTGVGFDRDTLQEAHVDRADAFAAVSSGDNSNVIAARVARETFGVARVAARIYDPGRAEVFERLGIPTVATVRWAVERLTHALVPDEHRTLWRDPTDTVAVMELPIHQGWVGRGIDELESAAGVRVGYLIRLGRCVLPTSDTVLQQGDGVHMLLTDDVRRKAMDVTRHPPADGH